MISHWFLCVTLVLSNSILNSLQSSGTSDEDKFFIKYRNNEQWEPLRIKRLDETGYMFDICDQAHKKAGFQPAEIVASGFDVRMLQHSEGRYESIPIDVIKYGIQVGNSTIETILRYWYITKGLADDCVFYLEPVDKGVTSELRLITDHHVCGLKM